VATKYILLALAVVFFTLAVRRIARTRTLSHPQSRTWLIIAVIFAAVSAWLFSQE
jgi:hypothetical protein